MDEPSGLCRGPGSMAVFRPAASAATVSRTWTTASPSPASAAIRSCRLDPRPTGHGSAVGVPGGPLSGEVDGLSGEPDGGVHVEEDGGSPWRRSGTRLGGQHVVDPDGRTIAEVRSAPQNARRRRHERRDSYLPGKPTLEREQPASSCLCFL